MPFPGETGEKQLWCGAEGQVSRGVRSWAEDHESFIGALWMFPWEIPALLL